MKMCRKKEIEKELNKRTPIEEILSFLVQSKEKLICDYPKVYVTFSESQDYDGVTENQTLYVIGQRDETREEKYQRILEKKNDRKKRVVKRILEFKNNILGIQPLLRSLEDKIDKENKRKDRFESEQNYLGIDRAKAIQDQNKFITRMQEQIKAIGSNQKGLEDLLTNNADLALEMRKQKNKDLINEIYGKRY